MGKATRLAFLCGVAAALVMGFGPASAGKRKGKKRGGKKPAKAAPANDQADEDADDSPAPAPEPPKPWAEGVSQEDQSRALVIYREGNQLFEQSQYPQALAKYRTALESWQHPAIHYNAAVCLVHLDQPLEARGHIEKALAFGEGPLGSELHKQGKTYLKLLNGRLATIEISTEQDGVEITLDGEPLLKGKGKASRLVMPGRHQVVAKKPGFLTRAWEVQPIPGKVHTEAVELVRPEATTSTRLVRRWGKWKPWLVTGAGVLIAGAGGGALALSRSDFAKFDEGFSRDCPDGCTREEMPQALRDLEDRAELERTVGVATLAIGGAVVATGVVLIILNQPKEVAVEHSPRVTPNVGRGSVGASLTLPF